MKLMAIILALSLTVGGWCEAKPDKKHPKKHHSHHAKGLKRDHKKFEAFKKKALHHKSKKLSGQQFPATLDLSGIASKARNQGQCGDCWAYAITKALQSELMINGNGGPSSLLDVEQLTGNCIGSVQEYGCNGGDFPAAQNLVAPGGSPANGVDPANGRGCPSGPIAGSGASFVMMDTNPTDQDIVEALNDKHVLVIDLAADDSWSNYPSGADTVAGVQVWDQTTSNSIDHMINRVGYICTGSGLSADGKSCVFGSDGNSPGIIYIDMNNWGDCTAATQGASWGVSTPNSGSACGYIYETRLANLSGQDIGYFTVTPPPAPPKPPTPPTPPAPPVPPAPPEPSCKHEGWFMCFLGCWVPGCH